MPALETTAELTADRAQRARGLVAEMRAAIFRRTDHMFAWLMLFQWLLGIVLALLIAPRTWAGSESQVHPHVWAAIFLGGAIAGFPIALSILYPGRRMTRHIIAIGQMLTSTLLIFITGGRIETHFHIFGSLAFLAFYCDWPVLITGSIVVAADHLVRGMFWPETVYGVAYVQPWRWLEHAGWVAFEDVFLIYATVQRCKEMVGIAEARASLENQQELIVAREEALAASRAKSEFLSSMSHEIRTPLNAILGMTELLGDSRLDAEQQRYLEVMTTNGNALLDLINSILDLAKIEAGLLQIESVDFDLVELIDQTVSTLSPRAHGKGLELVARIAPEVPEQLIGDPLRLRQILINLLGNALKFTETGEVRLSVERDAQPGQLAALRFRVADTGVGIAPARLETIFESFTQADSSTTRQYGGSGLGLAIVRRLAGLMGGVIAVESVVGSGSTFTLSARFGVATTAVTTSDQALPDLNGTRVLIVDDSPTNRQIARELVEGRGALVTETESGLGALATVRDADRAGNPFGLILLDMRMPGLDGLEVGVLIRREHQSRVPRTIEPIILMLSSDDLKEQLVRLRNNEFEVYVVKPLTRKALFEAITRVIGQQPRPALTQPQPVGIVSARRVSILVVDDSPDNRMVVAAYLRREPYELEFAEDGLIALEKFGAKRYDLVLMDIHMPRMDGYAATSAMRALELERGSSRTPIVALTASAFEEAAHSARDAGCDAHITKPVKKVTLLEAIRRYCAEPEHPPSTIGSPPARDIGHVSVL